MKIGDLIRTYYKGYFVLEKIERRFVTKELLFYDDYKKMGLGAELSPLLHFSQKYDENFKRKNSKQKSCDSLFCGLAINEILELEEKLIKLKEIIKEYEKG
jgi:hypothetical protein